MLHCSILWEKDQKKILLHVHSFPCHTTTSTCGSSLCATYPTQPPPSTHYPHLLSLLLLVTGTPLPELGVLLDLSTCIFPALPLSTPSCTHSACLYCCHSPIPPPAFARKHSATQSHALSSPLPQYLFLCTQDGHPWGLASAFAFAVITGKLRRI